MRNHTLFICAASSALLGFASLASAATVMEFPDNTELKGKAELQAYNFRSAPPITRQCAGTGSGGTFTVTKPVDGLSPQLAQASKAKKTALVQIDDTKSDGTHVAYQLTNAKINDIKPSNGGAMEQISFNYTKVQWVTVSPCKVTAAPRRNNNASVPGGGGYGGGYGGSGSAY